MKFIHGESGLLAETRITDGHDATDPHAIVAKVTRWLHGGMKWWDESRKSLCQKFLRSIHRLHPNKTA